EYAFRVLRNSCPLTLAFSPAYRGEGRGKQPIRGGRGWTYDGVGKNKENLMRKITSVLILLVALCGVGCATDKAVISQAAQMHQTLAPAVMNDQQLTNYLQQIGDRIIDSAKELDKEHFGPSSHTKEDSAWMFSNGMKFHFVNSKTLNAFTTGGEHM